MNVFDFDNEFAKQSAYIALDKAKALETERLKDGWQYIQITPREKILVPCDDNGVPTEKGKERIEQRKKSLCLS